MSPEKPSFEEALEALASKRDVLTDEAVKAKVDFDAVRDSVMKQKSVGDKKSREAMDLFNENIHLLLEVFSQSKFDEFITLLTNPTRLFLIHFVLGIFRGLGFAIGAILIFGLGVLMIHQWFMAGFHTFIHRLFF